MQDHNTNTFGKARNAQKSGCRVSSTFNMVLIKARQAAKRTRAANACKRCKMMKVKCNDFRPCKRCADSTHANSCCNENDYSESAKIPTSSDDTVIIPSSSLSDSRTYQQQPNTGSWIPENKLQNENIGISWSGPSQPLQFNLTRTMHHSNSTPQTTYFSSTVTQPSGLRLSLSALLSSGLAAQAITLPQVPPSPLDSWPAWHIGRSIQDPFGFSLPPVSAYLRPLSEAHSVPTPLPCSPPTLLRTAH
jgi:hypothetical protein